MRNRASHEEWIDPSGHAVTVAAKLHPRVVADRIAAGWVKVVPVAAPVADGDEVITAELRKAEK